MLRLFAYYYSEDEVLSNKDRMDKYKKHDKIILPPDELDKIHKRLVGEYRGIKLYVVDGEYVRGNVDLDYCLGGNGGRYKYCPEDELWCCDQENVEDMFSIFTHEFMEMVHMVHQKTNYDKGHDLANDYEIYVRRHKPMKSFKEWVDFVSEHVDDEWNIESPPEHEDEKKSNWNIKFKSSTIQGSL
jgi:hypothetical protein